MHGKGSGMSRDTSARAASVDYVSNAVIVQLKMFGSLAQKMMISMSGEGGSVSRSLGTTLGIESMY